MLKKKPLTRSVRLDIDFAQERLEGVIEKMQKVHKDCQTVICQVLVDLENLKNRHKT
jgi:hypothetical protein